MDDVSQEIHLFSFQLFHLIICLFLFIYLFIHALRLVPSHYWFSIMCHENSISFDYNYFVLSFIHFIIYLFIHILIRLFICLLIETCSWLQFCILE